MGAACRVWQARKRAPRSATKQNVLDEALQKIASFKYDIFDASQMGKPYLSAEELKQLAIHKVSRAMQTLATVQHWTLSQPSSSLTSLPRPIPTATPHSSRTSMSQRWPIIRCHSSKLSPRCAPAKCWGGLSPFASCASQPPFGPTHVAFAC